HLADALTSRQSIPLWLCLSRSGSPRSSDVGPRMAQAQWPVSPTFTDTTAVATASAMRPSTSDRIRPAPASREATYAVTPISAVSRNPDTSIAGPQITATVDGSSTAYSSTATNSAARTTPTYRAIVTASRTASLGAERLPATTTVSRPCTS